MGCIRFPGKVIAFLLLLIFFVLLPTVLLTFNVQQAMFERDTYQRVVEDPSLYTVFLPSLLPGLVRDIEQSPDVPPDARYAGQLFSRLDKDDWRDVTTLLAPVDWIQGQVEHNLDAFFTWIDAPQVAPDFLIDLTEMKRRLDGDEGREMVQLVIESWPACSASEADTMQQVLDDKAGAETSLPACLPGDDALRAQLNDSLNDAVAIVAEETPDALYAGGVSASGQQLSLAERTRLLNIKVAIRMSRRVPYLVFILPLAVLLLIEIITVRSFKELLRWCGWALSVGGLLSLIMLLVLTTSPLIGWQVALRHGWVEATMLPVTVGILSLLGQIARSILFQGGIITAAGLVMLGLASLFARREDRENIEEVEESG
jgi:hypothetical protein